jgi:branched-chain amino acid transport system ATP-binding protein
VTAILQTRGLVSGYGDVRILHGVDISVAEGGITAVLGSNGAGKTTLFRTLAGLLAADEGQIDLRGSRIDPLPSHTRVERGVVLVPEGRLVFPDMSVEENLRIGSVNKRARPQCAKTLSTVFDLFPILSERRKQAAGTLSGGEQQMLALGRGLMALPKVLLLDEPTLGLAPGMAKQIFQTLPNLVELGLTILIAEQDVHRTLQCAQFGYVLENGRVAVSGSGPELLQTPAVAEAFLGQ